LSYENPNINLYYWADRPDIATDWPGIFNTWPDHESLIRESVLTYLVHAHNTHTRVYQNEKFRDATFEAWAAYNKGSPIQRIDFSNATYYQECATNEEFMKWWSELAAKDKRHQAGYTWFIATVQEQ